MRSLRTVLTVAAMFALPTIVGMRAAASTDGATAADQGAMNEGSDAQKFVGTYRLVTTERKDANGTWSQTPGFNSIGYITYSDTGYMGVHIMPKERPKFAKQGEPTAEEAQQALRGYTAYYGPFKVDEAGKFVVHHRLGQINPGGVVDAKRFYDFEGDKLILTPAPADGGGKDQATSRLIWQRLPNANLSAEAKRFVGFRKLLYTDRYTEKDGKQLTHGEKNESRAGSYIIYTPTGHMMVHLMDKEGRKPYAGAQPTPEEALAAYRSYNGYFGPFEVHENEKPQYVMHLQEGTLQPGVASPQKRFYEFNGNVLRLGGPPQQTPNGELSGGHLYWELLPPMK